MAWIEHVDMANIFGGYTGRYAVLGYDPANEGGEWLSQDGKRRRRFMGGTFNNTGDYAGPETFDNNPRT